MGFPGFFMITSLIGNMLLPATVVTISREQRQRPVYTYGIRMTYTQKGCIGNVTSMTATLSSAGGCSPVPCADFGTWGSTIVTCNQMTTFPDASIFAGLCPGCEICGYLRYYNKTQCDPSFVPDIVSYTAIHKCSPSNGRPYPSESFGMCHRVGIPDNQTVYLNNSCTGVSGQSPPINIPSIACDPSQGYCTDPMFGGPPLRYYGFCSFATAIPPVPSSTTASSSTTTTTTRPASAPRLFAKGALIGFGLALAIGIMPTR